VAPTATGVGLGGQAPPGGDTAAGSVDYVLPTMPGVTHPEPTPAALQTLGRVEFTALLAMSMALAAVTAGRTRC
jgi:hypothetical protein